MPKANPLVSIVIPAYNKAELTVQTVESVRSQSYDNIEIIVVDDGSTDDTKDRLSFYKNIRYVYKENGGACSARNVGLNLAKGEYVGFLDCDDRYEADKVSLGVRFLEDHPDYGFVHTAAYFTDEQDQALSVYSHLRSRRQGWIAPRLIMGNFICNSTILARTQLVKEVRGFDESIFPPADWDMWLRLSERSQVGYINQPLTRYRVTDNYTFKRLELSREEELYVIDKFFKRNKTFGYYLKAQALSNFYLRYAQCYFLQGNYDRLRETFRLCLKKNPLNLKALYLLGSYFLARGWLRNELNRRILRHTN